MVEQTSVPEIMGQQITNLEGAIAFWEYAADALVQILAPYVAYTREVIDAAQEKGDIPPDLVDMAQDGLGAWEAPGARAMELLSFLRGFDVPEEGLGPQHEHYIGEMDHYNTVIRTTATAIDFCRRLYPSLEEANEPYLMSRDRTLETAALLEEGHGP